MRERAGQQSRKQAEERGAVAASRGSRRREHLFLFKVDNKARCRVRVRVREGCRKALGTRGRRIHAEGVGEEHEHLHRPCKGHHHRWQGQMGWRTRWRQTSVPSCCPTCRGKPEAKVVAGEGQQGGRQRSEAE